MRSSVTKEPGNEYRKLPEIEPRGGSRISIWEGGGGQKIMCSYITHVTSEKPEFPAYGRGPRGPGSSWSFGRLSLSRSILSLIFTHSDTKWDKNKQTKSIKF